MTARCVLAVAGVAWLAFAGLGQVVRTGDPIKRGFTATDFPRVQQLADGVYSYEQLRSAGAELFTTVSLFVTTNDGVLVADGQGSVTETKRMVDAIAKTTPRPITHVVIASDHGDHTAGNAAFPPGVTYLIHPTSKAVMDGGAWKAGPPAHLLVNDRTILKLGGREIHILFLGRAHTGGDLSVYLPAERILFMSEAYLNRIFPAMRSAFPSEWVRTIEKAQGMKADRYVPGHGFVETPAILEEELETFKHAIATVIAEGRRLHAAGVPVETAVTQAAFGDLDSWTLRKSQGPIAIRRVYLEIDGKLPK